MATTLATGDASAWAVGEQFLDLICGDADLLAAEFDAIVAAEWPTPPADGPGRGAAGDHPGCGETRRGAGALCGPVSRPRLPGIAGWARQRSPPFQDPSCTAEKGR
jgi:hypothetical protein